MFAAMTKGLLAAALISFSATAAASGYFAIEGSALSLVSGTDADHREQAISPSGIRLRLGTRISELLDLEGHIGFSFDDNNDQFDKISASYYGAYLKAYLPMGRNSALFVLGGITSVTIDQLIGNSEFSDGRNGVSYGIGLETRLTDNADLTADYMSYLREDGLFAEVSAFNFGVKLYF